MKAIAIKSLIIMSALLFVDFIIMILVGCTSCLFTPSTIFYECTYCTIGKIILLLSSVLFFIIFFLSFKPFVKTNFK
jgi:hypothetical protein